MGVFDLPTDAWTCQECGHEWIEDDATHCRKCGSEDIKKEQ